MIKEMFVPIVGYEGIYEISNLGRIKSLQKSNEKILNPTKLDKSKYLKITLWKCGVQKSYDIHRLVAIAFVENENNLPEVNHKDTIKHNNCSSNLEWCTRKQNAIHARINGLMVPRKGEENSFAVLTEKDVMKIRELHSTGKYYVADIARLFSVSFNCAAYAIKRKTWKHI